MNVEAPMVLLKRVLDGDIVGSAITGSDWLEAWLECIMSCNTPMIDF